MRAANPRRSLGETMTALPSACVLEATLKPRRPSMIIRQGMTDTGLVNLDAKSAKEVLSIQRSALRCRTYSAQQKIARRHRRASQDNFNCRSWLSFNVNIYNIHILTTCFSSLPTYLLATNTPIAKEARASSASKGRGEAVCGRPCAL